MLDLINVTKVYKTKAGDTAALNKLSLSLPDSGLVFITGKSGSGKTTLLNIIGALDGFDSGDIVIDGKRFSFFSHGDFSAYRNSAIGFVFQEYNLLPDYTVEKNIRIATELQGQKATDKEINEILSLVDLEGLNKRKPNELSGGQKQRVAIARALIKNPKIIMADEPTGALDQATGIQVMETLKKLSQNKLIIVVSHDIEIAEKYADRIIRLVDGKIVEDNTIVEKQVLTNVYEDEHGITVKQGASLSQTEKQRLLTAVKENKKISFSKNEKIRIKRSTEKDEKQPKTDTKTQSGKNKFVKSKMKLTSSMWLGVRSLNVKPIRLIFTILFSVLSFTLFGLFDSLSNFDETKAVANILQSQSYPTITGAAQYASNGLASEIRVSQQVIDNVNQATGMNFRGLYEINDSNYMGLGKSNVITAPDTQDAGRVGEDYYYKIVNDFVEFGYDEITSDGVIDPEGFNLKIIYGEYPKAPQPNDRGAYQIESFQNVAISKYTAEMILHWWKQRPGGVYNYYKFTSISGNTNARKRLDTIDDLIGLPIKVNNDRTFYVSGIIDCGAIPEKYDSLKSLVPNSTTNLLSKDLLTYLDSGLYFKLFVPQGYVDLWRDFTGRANRYFTKSSSFTLDGSPLTGDLYNSTSFYKAEDHIENGKSDNIYLFNSNNISLNNKQVLINVKDFRNFYQQELINYYNLDEQNEEKLSIFLEGLNSDEYRPSALYYKPFLDEILAAFNECNITSLNKTVTLTQQYSNSDKVSKTQCEIVGIYSGIDGLAESAIYIPVNNSGNHTPYPLMLSSSFLDDLGVYSSQDKYIRMISPMTSDSNSIHALANLFSKGEGVKIAWFGNTTLVSLYNNRTLLNQVTDILLYVSIALAAFSVFMLFNYIAISINSRKQSVGVLKALGSKNRDIALIFFTESLIIAILNGLLACVAAAFGCVLMNTYIQKVVGLTINFAIYGMRQIYIIAGISLATGIIASLLPIIKICRRKPVTLIRKP